MFGMLILSLSSQLRGKIRCYKLWDVILGWLGKSQICFILLIWSPESVPGDSGGKMSHVRHGK